MKKLRRILFLGILIFIKFSGSTAVLLSKPKPNPSVKVGQIRDPFYLPSRKIYTKKTNELKVIGIISSSNKKAAIVLVNGQQESVFIGDKIAKFNVNEIGSNFILIESGKLKKKLFIQDD